MGFVMGYLWIFWKNHPKLERFHEDIHWRIPPTWYDFWVCLKMGYTHEMVILWETWWTGGFFFWASFFAKNLSSHDPTYWFQIVKKGDWLVLGVVEPGPWLAVPTVWSHHVYLSLFRDGCDSDTWPIWIRVGPKFCARLLQLPGIFRMWCWSPVSATAMVLSTLPESKTQMAQIATVEMLSKRWTFAMAEVEIGNMLGMHTAQEAYKEIVQNLWKNVPWLTNERRTIRSFVRIRN